jgi:type IV pilus assembly protein PilW
MRPTRMRGLTLVELMIGLAVGLFIVAVATALLVNRLREHQLTLIEGRLLQDLRTSADVVTRDLRRAGYWGDATVVLSQTGQPRIENPYNALAPASAASDAVSFRFSRDTVENHTVDSNEQFGFRLRRGVLEMLLGGSGWQAMTDSGTMVVTAFSVTPLVQEIALQGVCEQTCSSASCSPTQQVRSLGISITGRSAADARVLRTVRINVRLRNDAVSGACPA